jgi:hypothetical protein
MSGSAFTFSLSFKWGSVSEPIVLSSSSYFHLPYIPVSYTVYISFPPWQSRKHSYISGFFTRLYFVLDPASIHSSKHSTDLNQDTSNDSIYRPKTPMYLYLTLFHPFHPSKHTKIEKSGAL